MVIAKCLRSPRQASMEMAASAGTPRPQRFPLIGMKFAFNNLRGLIRPRHKLPFLDSVLANLNQQGVPPDDASSFHAPVWGNDDFDFDLALHVHSLCEVRIDGCRFGL